jgi:hypothetical protein
MPEIIEPFEPDAVAAMYAVVAEGDSATDAWLGFLRARHPGAVDALARAAMASVALDLLVANGDMSVEEASRQMLDAATSAADAVSEDVWASVVRFREVLEVLERHAAASGVVRIEDDEEEEEPVLQRYLS